MGYGRTVVHYTCVYRICHSSQNINLNYIKFKSIFFSLSLALARSLSLSGFYTQTRRQIDDDDEEKKK